MFAKTKRISDITLSDYAGLGKITDCNLSSKKVSCVLLNTENGSHFFEKLVSSHNVFAMSRPIQESILTNPRLREPTPKNRVRIDFEKEIGICNDFDQIMKNIIYKDKRRTFFIKILELPLKIYRKFVDYMRFK